MRIGSVRRVVSLAVLSLFFSLNVFAQAVEKIPLVPDRTVTPGELCNEKDPDYAGPRYEAKIPYCERNVSNTLKAEIYDQYKIPESQRRYYTIDHFIPLSIGGNNDRENLWPEHKKIKQTRLNLELEIFEAVRDGKMSQQEAIERIDFAKMHPEL